MDEVLLAERLIAYDTSRRAGIGLATDFVAGWLEARGARVERLTPIGGRRCLIARVGVGPARLILHGHLDVVPGHPEQFVPRREGGRLYGRGAYDMKAALAAMMLAVDDLGPTGAPGVEVLLVVTPDEERTEPGENCTEVMVRDGLRGDFVVCGEPTDLQVGVQAKGVLILRIEVPGVAAHGSNEHVEIDSRYLPGQRHEDVLAQVRSIAGDARVEVLIQRPPADVAPDDPHVTMLLDAVAPHEPSAASVGRDGASDAVAFLGVGVTAVEFGPTGAGHHGPNEHVEIDSLVAYRQALAEFARAMGRRAVATAADRPTGAAAGR